jgi:YGGT family
VNTNPTYDSKLALDEARRAGQHGAAKSQVEAEVQSELAVNATRTAADNRRLDEVARGLHTHAVDEVVETENEVGRARVVARISQVVDYGFMLLYALLAIRFGLALLAARSSAGFVKLVVAVTDPFYAPFKGIVSSPRLDGGHTVLVPLIVAFAAYVVLHLAINGLLRLFAQRKTTI